MRCAYYCNTNAYDIQKLLYHYSQNGVDFTCFDDVIYTAVEDRNHKTTTDIFCFSFGVVVIWGMDKTEEMKVLDQLAEIFPDCHERFVDEIYYQLNTSIQKSYIDEEKNTVILSEDSILTKLSISYALAQSVKLTALENSVAKLMEKTTPIQKELSTVGTVSLSKKEIAKQIGMLFYERYAINIHNEILDIPEFFWKRPSYEPLYLSTAESQDIQIRQNILNKRLDLVQELYMLLSSELNYVHSTKLEIVIIWLIAIEVILAISHTGVFTTLLSWIGF